MWQISEDGDYPRWQGHVAPLPRLSLVGPQDRPSACEIDIPPIEFERFAHSHTGADQQYQQCLQVGRRCGDQALGLVGQQIPGAAFRFTWNLKTRSVTPAA